MTMEIGMNSPIRMEGGSWGYIEEQPQEPPMPDLQATKQINAQRPRPRLPMRPVR